MAEKRKTPITVKQLVEYFKPYRDESDTKVVVKIEKKSYHLGWCNEYGNDLLFDRESDPEFGCTTEAFWNDLESNYSKQRGKQYLYYHNDVMNLRLNGYYKVIDVKKYGKYFHLVVEKVVYE